MYCSEHSFRHKRSNLAQEKLSKEGSRNMLKSFSQTEKQEKSARFLGRTDIQSI